MPSENPMFNKLLNQPSAIDDKENRQMALDDMDLEPLWEKIEEI